MPKDDVAQLEEQPIRRSQEIKLEERTEREHLNRDFANIQPRPDLSQ